MGRSKGPWNINIHYDRLLADLAPAGSRVLDVGCGDGFLSARLADIGCLVVAVDVDANVLGRAAQRWPGKSIEWLHQDVFSPTLEPASFDVVVSNATLHHLPDTTSALERLADLVRPGGRLGVVGFATNGPLNWPMSLVSSIGIHVVVPARGKWEHSAPVVWPPPLTYGQVRRVSGQILPGRDFRRLWLGRFLMTWVKPQCAEPGSRATPTTFGGPNGAAGPT